MVTGLDQSDEDGGEGWGVGIGDNIFAIDCESW